MITTEHEDDGELEDDGVYAEQEISLDASNSDRTTDDGDGKMGEVIALDTFRKK